MMLTTDAYWLGRADAEDRVDSGCRSLCISALAPESICNAYRNGFNDGKRKAAEAEEEETP